MNKGSALKVKEERIEIRVNREVKDCIQKAADAMGVTLTAFTTQQLYEAAKKTLTDLQVLVLSNQDRDQFLALLDSPPKANQALSSLFKKYSK